MSFQSKCNKINNFAFTLKVDIFTNMKYLFLTCKISLFLVFSLRNRHKVKYKNFILCLSDLTQTYFAFNLEINQNLQLRRFFVCPHGASHHFLPIDILTTPTGKPVGFLLPSLACNRAPYEYFHRLWNTGISLFE
jgi:hypothetical protein